MKAITIRQPWANLVAQGLKTVETRNWKTSYRGPLAIHAGKVANKEAFDILKKTDLEEFMSCELSIEPRGVIIAVTELIYIIEYHDSEDFYDDILSHSVPPEFAYTRYGWCFPCDPRKKKRTYKLNTPIPWRGMPGLFDVPDSILKS
jgi:hypothetical protein